MAKLQVEAVKAKMLECNGNLAAVGRAFGVTRQAVWLMVHKHPTLQEISRDCTESMKDHAESALYRGIFNGEAWAICFFLKTRGKDRGYVERQEVQNEHSGEVALRIVKKIVEVKHEDDRQGNRPQPLPE